MTGFEEVMSALTTVYVLVTGYYAVITHRTLKAIQKQASLTEGQSKSSADQFTKELVAMTESRQQTAELIKHASDQVQALIIAGEVAQTHANATQLLVEAASKNVGFSELNAQAARENAMAAKAAAEAAMLSSRAIMDAERAIIVCKFKASDTLHMLSISNCGRTPAHIKDVKFIRRFPLISDEPHLPDDPDYGLPTQFLHARILCAGELWEAADWCTMMSPTELTEQMFKEITSGRRRYYIFGRVDYKDVFRDITHETGFCFFYSPPLREFIIGGPPEYTKYT